MGERHPVDLPEGYHAAPRAQAWQGRRRLGQQAAPGVRRGRATPGLRDAAGLSCRRGPAGVKAVRQPFVRTSTGPTNVENRQTTSTQLTGRAVAIVAGRRSGPTRSASTCSPSVERPAADGLADMDEDSGTHMYRLRRPD